ncbi:MarR family transcriptional regulator [Vibrio neptunius]|uniref:MarR family winged helix-turn-helix transcriptional regulator n=1 Tax=Vibrio neptunius TaxID=170651 RepID=UPI0005F9C286|nr:MarR family transcriptional regulator [Vibrio neptunius]KJY87581.1 MarR family transcriptional regulator [Vibrio neptunius]
MSEAKQHLSTLALSVFSLHGHFLSIAESIATQAGLTATRWQVLGAVGDSALTQAEIARQMGITRQSVQRTSKQLIDEGLLETLANPSHRKAMLLQPTQEGYKALAKLTPFHSAYAQQLVDELGEDKLAKMAQVASELSAAMDKLKTL